MARYLEKRSPPGLDKIIRFFWNSMFTWGYFTKLKSTTKCGYFVFSMKHKMKYFYNSDKQYDVFLKFVPYKASCFYLFTVLTFLEALRASWRENMGHKYAKYKT